jgi:hypothetical protein
MLTKKKIIACMYSNLIDSKKILKQFKFLASIKNLYISHLLLPFVKNLYTLNRVMCFA